MISVKFNQLGSNVYLIIVELGPFSYVHLKEMKKICKYKIKLHKRHEKRPV